MPSYEEVLAIVEEYGWVIGGVVDDDVVYVARIIEHFLGVRFPPEWDVRLRRDWDRTGRRR